MDSLIIILILLLVVINLGVVLFIINNKSEKPTNPNQIRKNTGFPGTPCEDSVVKDIDTYRSRGK